MHVAAAVGNNNADGKNTSPECTPGFVAVGASAINDARDAFSNFGPVQDIFAPGEDIISAWIASNTAFEWLQAAPHISGLIAYLIGRDRKVSPAEMTVRLQGLNLKGILTGISASFFVDSQCL
ncbi:hypothetical protein H0H81_007737 [Sphagnurus paluster]|uniref:Peptidase S8/S53 domain-containing protein n=1 Tax=Sphagnurus paluster TaxID=117069 RepID=A0A9P7KJ69_9AGAR|nr:hypothetical protein H0H81_007737 [Sphagnurus paluster]